MKKSNQKKLVERKYPCHKSTGVEIRPRAGQIGHYIDNALPTLRHFFKRNYFEEEKESEQEYTKKIKN